MNNFKIFIPLFVVIFILMGCQPEAEQVGVIDIDAVEARQLLESRDEIVIIDVRSPREYSSGHIPGAVLLPHDAADFALRLGEYTDADALLVYCLRGTRSRYILPLLKENFTGKIYHLKTGYRDWMSKNTSVN